MKTFAILLILLCCSLPTVSLGAGTWIPLVHRAPASVDTMLLLSDGSVMAANADNQNGWLRLKPDSQGSYVEGAWSTLASMHYTRLYYSSAVLTNGNVFIAGGEYGTGTNSAEWYDSVSNRWNPGPPALSGQRLFFDSISKLLPNGNVLIAPVNPATSGGTVIYNTASNSFSAGPTLFRGYYQDEASWVRLPDDSILTIDPFGQNSERYVPSLNNWINDADLPVPVYDPYGGEMGAGFVLPDGRAFFLGATGNTVIYTPSGGNAMGTWQAGPPIPNGQGTPDAPAAMMVNGKILCAVSPIPFSNNNVFTTPTSFYEYDPVANAFTQVNGPTGSTYPDVSYGMRMLQLPDGNVLLSISGQQLYVYQRDGAPLAAGKPSIVSISRNSDHSFHLRGTLLNGISAGAAYGDDAQMDSNYPLIRLTNAMTGTVLYARTFGWTSTSIMTGTNIVSTEFTVPGMSLGGTYSLVVVANGNSSDPVVFTNLGNSFFSGLVPKNFVMFGTSNVLLSGVVSSPGPAYPNAGETVTVTINGNAQTTTIADATGDFSIAYNLSAIPFNTNSYPITYSYAGNDLIFSTTDTNTTLLLLPAWSITNQPAGQSQPPGGIAVFTVGLSGPGPFTYQWLFNGTNLPNGMIQTVAGSGLQGYSGDGGQATNAALYWPSAVSAEASGNLLIVDEQNNCLRQALGNGLIRTLAGNGVSGFTGDFGAATNATLTYPDGIAHDAFGNLYIVDSGNNAIRWISTDGTIRTVAGNGSLGYSGDNGFATNATLYFPESAVVDGAGNLYISDSYNNAIRLVDTNGIICTVAGNGIGGFSGDGGPATNATLSYPYGLALDVSNNLFVAEAGNHVIRKITAGGVIRTVAGTPGNSGYGGDGGPATSAALNFPAGIALDQDGNLLIADSGNSVIRKLDAGGVINTVVGNGYASYAGDGGPATNASLSGPYGLAFDTVGNLLIADTFNNRIREVLLTAGYSRLVLNNLTPANAGDYSVVISTGYSSVTSSIASLTVSWPAPRVVGQGITNGTFQFSWSSTAGLHYQVQTTANLALQNWVDAGNPITATGLTTVFVDAVATDPQRFYRVILMP